MDIEKFVDLVGTMRDAQTLYFKTKNRNTLQRSIILEGLVDEEIRHFKEEQAVKNRQPDLFDGVQ